MNSSNLLPPSVFLHVLDFKIDRNASSGNSAVAAGEIYLSSVRFENKKRYSSKGKLIVP